MTTVKKALALAVLVTACGCDDPASPQQRSNDELTVRLESGHGIYFHAPGDAVDTTFQEGYYRWLFGRLGVEPEEKLVFHKYRDIDHMERMTGDRTNGWAEIGNYRFHTIWELDNHESVHALVNSEWGLAPALLNEGVAVAHQYLSDRGYDFPQWSGTHVDTLAVRWKRSGDIPALETLLTSRDFFMKHDAGMTYPLAGSFTTSVIERHGYGKLEAFFRSSTFEDGADACRVHFREAFGEEIEVAWERWLKGLGA